MAKAKTSPDKDIHLTVQDKGELKRAAQHIKISDPLLLPFEINVKKGSFNVVKPFTVKSGASKGTVIDYIQYTGKNLSEAIAYIMKQRNSLPEGEGAMNKKEVVSLEGFLKKSENRATEIVQLLKRFDELFENKK